jgi:hypothetical protein
VKEKSCFRLRIVAGFIGLILLINLVACDFQGRVETESRARGFAEYVKVWNDLGMISQVPSGTSGLARALIYADESQDSQVVGLDADTLLAYQKIISDPKDSLASFSQDECGSKYLAVFDSIVNEESVGDVYDKMEVVSPEMAESFLESITELMIVIPKNEVNARAVQSANVRNLRLIVPQGKDSELQARALGDFDWENVAVYVGLSATCIAGLTVYKYAPLLAPWVKAAGLIAAGASSVGMSTYVGYWAVTNSSFMDAVSGLLNTSLTISGDFALRFATVAAATAAVGGFAYIVTPEIATFVYNGTINVWNALIARICALVPSGVTIIINGVILAPLPKKE